MRDWTLLPKWVARQHYRARIGSQASSANRRGKARVAQEVQSQGHSTAQDLGWRPYRPLLWCEERSSHEDRACLRNSRSLCHLQTCLLRKCFLLILMNKYNHFLISSLITLPNFFDSFFYYQHITSQWHTYPSSSHSTCDTFASLSSHTLPSPSQVAPLYCQCTFHTASWPPLCLSPECKAVHTFQPPSTTSQSPETLPTQHSGTSSLNPDPFFWLSTTHIPCGPFKSISRPRCA